MAHHYKTNCNNCYRYQMCKDELCDLELTEKRYDNAKKANAPFVPYSPNSREAYRNWWLENGQLIGMSNHDCYMTKNDFLQKYGAPKDSADIVPADKNTVWEMIKLMSDKKAEYMNMVKEAKSEVTQDIFSRYIRGMDVLLETVRSFAKENDIDISDIIK